MKIAINTDEMDMFVEFNSYAKEHGHEIINVKVQTVLFDVIENRDDIDVYVLDNYSNYFKKAVDFIKKRSPYVPVLVFFKENAFINTYADMYISIPFIANQERYDYTEFVSTVIYNANNYVKSFEVLKKLTTPIKDIIEFGNCKYDPIKRTLYYREKEIKTLSAKEGGILEVLSSNYNEVVKKEVILEKVWRKNDYFAGRSMDVYITYLRNTFKQHKIKLTIKNINGVGLILE